MRKLVTANFVTITVTLPVIITRQHGDSLVTKNFIEFIQIQVSDSSLLETFLRKTNYISGKDINDRTGQDRTG